MSFHRVASATIVVLIPFLVLGGALPVPVSGLFATPPAHALSASPGPGAHAGVPGASPHPTAPPHFRGLSPGAFHPGATRPASWGADRLPPGAPTPRTLFQPSPAGGANGSGAVNWSALKAYCYGVWPTLGGQGQYLPECYGHDEPGLNPYSNLPGSGGNVTWTVTLPTDGNLTNVQSTLYAAIWFGMVLTDPFAWVNQCYLELQFYPDSAWGISGPLPGNWIGAAVAWQIEAATGFENPCFYQQLTTTGSSSYFNMAQGDTIRVTMEGWVGDPYGENLTITDLTSGMSSFVNMYNGAQHYALDPAYATDTFPNALQWTPGGELPVTFAFETGHAGSGGFPENNSYGGCSPGPPPSNPMDPAVPCPSYDPGAWINASATPWQIQPPVFFNAQTSVRATQVGFGQDLGAILFVDPISNGVCTGRDGSAWCSYPWFSFSCRFGGFQFGATDYPGVTSDFGQYQEYARNTLTNAANIGSFYPPSNFSIPACGAPTYSVTATAVGGSLFDSVLLVGHRTTSSETVSGLLGGTYSLSATPTPGRHFLQWVTTGSVTVDNPSSPWAALNVTGGGTVSADFSATPAPAVLVQFADLGFHGWQAIAPGFTIGPTANISSIGIGGQIWVRPGIYSIIAYPHPGYNFTSWQSNSTGAQVAAPGFPFTWLVITGSAPSVTLTASFTASTVNATVTIFIAGGGSGTLMFNGHAVSSFSTLTLQVGAFSLVATPTAGDAVQSITASGICVLMDTHPSTNVTLENGSSSVSVSFELAASVTLLDVPGNGTISFSGGSPQPSGTTIDPFESFASSYALYAIPPNGERFVSWSVSSTLAAWVANPGSAVTAVTLNSTSTVTAHFAAAAAWPVTFAIAPVGSAVVGVDGAVPMRASLTTLNLTNGSYILSVGPSPGYTTWGWTSSGNASLTVPSGLYSGLDEKLTVSGSGGVRLAPVQVAGITFPVTLVTDIPTGTIRALGFDHPTGTTLFLTPGQHPISASFPAPFHLSSWQSTANLTVVGGASPSLVVNGSGSLYALSPWILPVTAVANLTRAPVPADIGFSAVVTTAVLPIAASWNFGDGSHTVFGTSVNHTYAAVGSYNATVSVVDSTGAIGSSFVGVRVIPPPLTSRASANLTSGTAPLSVTFTGSAAGGVAPYNLTWAFGDATPTALGSPVVHTFQFPGTYSVTFWANDSGRQHIYTLLSLTVRSSLNATFTATPTSGTTPLLVSFHGTASTGRPPYTYLWTYGDGSGGGGASTTHTYRVPGSFSVHLTVGDALGYTANASATITANAPLVPLSASLAVAPSPVALGGAVTFTTAVRGGVGADSFAWSGMPPGCAGVTANVTCTPSAGGTYSVNVLVKDSVGHTANGTTTLTVTPAVGGHRSGTVSSGSLIPPVLLYVLLGAGLAAVIGVFLYRRRHPPQDPESTPSPEPTVPGTEP